MKTENKMRTQPNIIQKDGQLYFAHEVRTKTKIMQRIKYSKDIQICELMRPDDSRYFTAKICGWKNFKFISDTLKAQPLLEATLEKCKEITEKINSDSTYIETAPTIIQL